MCFPPFLYLAVSHHLCLFFCLFPNSSLLLLPISCFSFVSTSPPPWVLNSSGKWSSFKTLIHNYMDRGLGWPCRHTHTHTPPSLASLLCSLRVVQTWGRNGGPSEFLHLSLRFVAGFIFLLWIYDLRKQESKPGAMRLQGKNTKIISLPRCFNVVLTLRWNCSQLLQRRISSSKKKKLIFLGNGRFSFRCMYRQFVKLRWEIK